MAKKRKAARPTFKRRASRRSSRPAKRRTHRPVEFAKSSLTIRFTTESELSDTLAALATLFDLAATGGTTLEAAGRLDSCLSVLPAARVVAHALSPKNFVPTEKLGDTYLTSQERELFRARVVRGVSREGCQIADADVPAGEATTHSAVVMALRQNAHA
jgi:hypothetical protein